MRIVFLNQFFTPDTAATGQLLADVASGLTAGGHEVHIICSRGKYAGGKIDIEASPLKNDHGKLYIHRLKAFSLGRDKTYKRLCDWISFYILAFIKTVWLGRMDVCIALTTPPFIAIVGIFGKLFYRNRLIIWSMDLWPDVAEELGHLHKGGMASRFLRSVACRTYKRADKIISLGEFMTGRLQATGVDLEKIVEVDNWVPGEVVKPVDVINQLTGLEDNSRYISKYQSIDPMLQRHSDDGRFIVMYSGNMGSPHEFETILNAAELLKDIKSIEFIFVGGGQRREELISNVKKRNLINICFLPFQPLENLSDLLAMANVHLVSMCPGVEGCIVPSKIYGIMAVGRPVIMVGSTENEISVLLKKSGAGFSVKQGCAREMADIISAFKDKKYSEKKMGLAGYMYYKDNLGMDRSVGKIIEVIMNQNIKIK